MSKAMCRIPVAAQIVVENGVATMTDAEYWEIPADDIAEFLIEKFGRESIFGKEMNDRDMGIPETTLLYMARDWAKWAQDNFNAYTLSLSRIIKEAKDEAGTNLEERTIE